MKAEAIILAGGFGTRLAGVVSGIPKPMAPVAGRPFLEYVVDAFSKAGIKRVILSTGYLSQIIENHFGQRYGDVEVAYSVEDHPLGTGGAIRAALVGISSMHAVVVNGDTFVDVDIEAMLDLHVNSGAAFTMALAREESTARYGRVMVENDRVCGFSEKSAGQGAGWINAGVYVIEKTLFDSYELSETFSIETDFLTRYLDRLQPRAFFSKGLFIDIGIPEDYARAQSIFSERNHEKDQGTIPR